MPSYLLSYPDESEPTYLDVEPVEYRVGPPARRSSSHPTMGGGRVHQDFGVQEADREISLRTEWMEQATLDAFAAKFAVTGQVWRWLDGDEHEWTVFFRELRPDRLRGQAAYEVEMIFDVIEAVS